MSLGRPVICGARYIVSSGAFYDWPAPAHPTPGTETSVAGVGGKSNTKVHRRDGIVMAVVARPEKIVYKLTWKYIDTSEVGTLRGWWEEKYFYFCPTSGGVGTAVVWSDKAFSPTKLRGDYYDLTATLEEV